MDWNESGLRGRPWASADAQLLIVLTSACSKILVRPGHSRNGREVADPAWDGQ